jgi:spermidine/putrescine transport system ATP-binding protein
MRQPTVELKQVSKTFTSRQDRQGIAAVVDVDIQIQPGEFFTLLGPSGCGKTTTLRLIAGFETPTRGEVLIEGKLVNQVPPNKRPVNTVFQNYALFPHLNVEQNVAYGLVVKRVPTSERRQRVQEALKMVRMNGLEDRKPVELSGGQQQRVALARALVNRPTVLLLDEPLGALDLKLRKEMQVELKQLQSQVGITFIYVTHDQEEALTMSDRIAVMHQGCVLQIDTPLAIYDEPTCRFVADFIGETNFLTGIVEGFENGVVHLKIARETIQIPRGKNSIHASQAVAIAIRPEKLMLASREHINGKTAADNTILLPGILKDAVFLGTDTRYIVELETGENLSVRVQNAGEHGPGEFRRGEPVKVWCEAEDARVLAD